MCVNQRKIRNRYTGQYLYVKCGHCPACLQQKAAYRTARIRSNYSPNLDCLMVTLTYRRDACPYILRKDAYEFSHGKISVLPVYRDSEFRKIRFNANYDIGYKKYIGVHKVNEIDFVEQLDFSKCKDLKFQRGKIGVSLYSDYQKFMARLRLNLNRRFNYYENIKIFACSEYGSASYRPHFHLLLWIRKGDFEVVRNAVVSSWPYGDLSRFDRAVEIAERASSYVASYVNSGSDFPRFLQKTFPPKHSYSKFFGSDAPLFQLPKILEKFERGHLTYNTLQVRTGKIVECIFPKYVVSRYFPQFKGYNRIAPTAFQSVGERFCSLTEPELSSLPCDSQYLEQNHPILEGSQVFVGGSLSDYDFIRRLAYPVVYVDDDFHKISVRLNNAYRRYLRYSGNYITRSEYIALHRKIWNLYNSEVLRLHLQDVSVPLNEKYYNLDDVLARNMMPVGFTDGDFKEIDPNRYSSVISSTLFYTDAYYEHIKHRKVNNAVVSILNEEF